jgi:hypothetical protein
MTASLESIEGFAQLCARLKDDFSSRAAVLSSAGLDEASWTRIEAYWLFQLAGNEPDLATRFAAIYGKETRRDATTEPGQALGGKEPGVAVTSVFPWLAEVRAVGLATTGEAPPLQQAPSWAEDTQPGQGRSTVLPDDDHTLAALPILRNAVMPFAPERSQVGELGTAAPPSAHRAPLPLNEGENTLDCPLFPETRSALPFQQAPNVPPPVKRLHRFDPQTGLPLPAPVWVDLPLSPSLKP